MSKLFIKIKNYFFCLRYPFWKSRNVFTDKFLGYDFTLYDIIPKGWRIAFGKQLCRDLKKALKKDKQLKEFRFSDIKEKYGRLCLYHFGAGENTFEVLRKYEDLSCKYCVNCGKPAKYKITGWIEYLCEECVKNDLKHIPRNIWKEALEIWRIKEDDQE